MSQNTHARRLHTLYTRDSNNNSIVSNDISRVVGHEYNTFDIMLIVLTAVGLYNLYRPQNIINYKGGDMHILYQYD